VKPAAALGTQNKGRTIRTGTELSFDKRGRRGNHVSPGAASFICSGKDHRWLRRKGEKPVEGLKASSGGGGGQKS